MTDTTTGAPNPTPTVAPTAAPVSLALFACNICGTTLKNGICPVCGWPE